MEAEVRVMGLLAEGHNQGVQAASSSWAGVEQIDPRASGRNQPC